ncbi:hypothetical protein WMY93_000894 [Mugilogobius chulae]|uniref:Uncharacterized protein n=1 Tax=Mugilogobius chulae TaxID=88201 RepID=A0AAW0Q089_9GOBI
MAGNPKVIDVQPSVSEGLGSSETSPLLPGSSSDSQSTKQEPGFRESLPVPSLPDSTNEEQSCACCGECFHGLIKWCLEGLVFMTMAIIILSIMTLALITMAIMTVAIIPIMTVAIIIMAIIPIMTVAIIIIMTVAITIMAIIHIMTVAITIMAIIPIMTVAIIIIMTVAIITMAFIPIMAIIRTMAIITSIGDFGDCDAYDDDDYILKGF